MTVALS